MLEITSIVTIWHKSTYHANYINDINAAKIRPGAENCSHDTEYE